MQRMHRLGRVGSSEGTTTRGKALVPDVGVSLDQLSREKHMAHKRTRKAGHGGGNDEEFAAPITVHANYCGTKKTCLRDRGLWLLDSYSEIAIDPVNNETTSVLRPVCNAFNKGDTKYGRPTWAYSIESGETHLKAFLDTLVVGDVIRFGRNPEVFIVDYPAEQNRSDSSYGLKVLRPVPNLATFDRLGFPHSMSLSVKSFSTIGLGREIMDLTKTNISYQITENLTFATIYAAYKVYEKEEDIKGRAEISSIKKAEDEMNSSTRSNGDSVPLTEGQKYWQQKIRLAESKESHGNRAEQIGLNVKAAKGTYRDAKVSALHGVEQTVLMCVLPYDDVMSIEHFETLKENRGIGMFSLNLRNFLSSIEGFGLKPLLYVTPSVQYTGMDSAAMHDNLRRVLGALMGSKTTSSSTHFEIAHSYPTALFFSFYSAVSSWTRDLSDSWDLCSAMGEVPSVMRFGLPTAIVPVLELLGMGLDVIFIDAGVRLLRDPIPHLTANHFYNEGRTQSLKGIPDISFAKESLVQKGICDYRYYDFNSANAVTGAATAASMFLGSGAVKNSSSVLDIFLGTERKSELVQPNFSLMRVLSTNSSLSFLRRWVQAMAATGDRTGQKSLDFAGSNFTESSNCNVNFPSSPPPSSPHGRYESGGWSEGGAGTYCYYNGVSMLTYNQLTKCHPRYSKAVKATAAPEPFVTAPAALVARMKGDQLKEDTPPDPHAALRASGASEVHPKGNEVVAVLVHSHPLPASYHSDLTRANYFEEL